MIVASLLVAAALMADNAHKEFLTDPPPAENTGTEENKADVIKRIVALRKQLRGQGQTLKPFAKNLSLEQLKKYEKNLSKKIGTTVQSSQGKGTEENKTQRDAIIKRIQEIRKQLRGQGQTLQPFNSTTLSLEQLKNIEKKLSKKIGTVQSSQGKGTEENKTQRHAIVVRIKALREQLRGQGQAVQSLHTVNLSLDALKNLEADLKKQAGKSTTGAPPDPKYVDAAKCSQKTSKEQQKMYDYDMFILHKASNTWKCASGWIPTGCWTGMTNGNKQCYRKKTNVRVTEPDTRSEDVKTLVADIQRIAKEIKGLGGRVTGSTRYRTAQSIQDVAKLQNRRDELNTQLADLKATNNTPGAAPPPVEYVAPATPAPESTPAPVSFFYTPVSSTDPSAMSGTEDRDLLIKGIKDKRIQLINLGLDPVGGIVETDFSSWTIKDLQETSKNLNLQVFNAPAAATPGLPNPRDPKYNSNGTFDSIRYLMDARIAGVKAPAGTANVYIPTDANSKIEEVCYRADNKMSIKIVDYVVSQSPSSFVIATWVGRGGIATGHTQKFHVECNNGKNGVMNAGYNLVHKSKGFDVYVWAPGATGTFTHLNSSGFGNWAMNGGKFQESWRSGTDKSTVTIAN
jgi:hypothetical protein